MKETKKTGLKQIGFMQGAVIVYSFCGVFQKLAARYPMISIQFLWLLHWHFICVCDLVADDSAQSSAHYSIQQSCCCNDMELGVECALVQGEHFVESNRRRDCYLLWCL